VLAKLNALNIAPIRRRRRFHVHPARLSDAAGILPTAEKWKIFPGDKSPDKRKKLIDALVEREEFVDTGPTNVRPAAGLEQEAAT